MGSSVKMPAFRCSGVQVFSSYGVLDASRATDLKNPPNRRGAESAERKSKAPARSVLLFARFGQRFPRHLGWEGEKTGRYLPSSDLFRESGFFHWGGDRQQGEEIGNSR